MALIGDNVDPGSMFDKIEHKRLINEAENKKQRQFVEEQFRRWKDFRTSPHGEVCVKLAEPKIRHLEYRLGLSCLEVMNQFHVPLDMVENLRAEWRGERRVWYQIMNDTDRLRRELDLIEGGTEEKEKKGLSWLPIPERLKK